MISKGDSETEPFFKTTLKQPHFFLALCLAEPMGFSPLAGEVILSPTIVDEEVTADLNAGNVTENAGPTQDDGNNGEK